MKKIIGASIGSCVHVAGLFSFLQIAKDEGYHVDYMGGAVPLEKLVEAIIEVQPNIVSIGYRLSSDALENLLISLENSLKESNIPSDIIFSFGGTAETAEVARKFKFITKVFDGTEEPEESVMFLRSAKMNGNGKIEYPQTLRERIEYKKPYPLIRHHIGLSTLEETEEQIKILSESGLLDIISLAPDQNCQQYYFEQGKMDHRQDGAGGAPIRSVDDLKRMYNATRMGNFPILRCYSGTENLLEFSKILKENINNGWAAIPLTWYSDLDRRSERSLIDAIKENQEAIKWNAENGVPVEINESHQWALRFCHDAVEVAMAYIVTYNAKKLGVKDYILQFMLSTPSLVSPKMDIAKMLAKIDLVKDLESDEFRIIRMLRPGLLSYPADEDAAKGQLASAIFYGAYLKPDIIHVVSYCEALYRATAKEIIESIKIAKRSLLVAQRGLPDFESDPEVRTRKETLKNEAMEIINAIIKIGQGAEDPLTDPEVLNNAVKYGILDAPCLKGFSVAKGDVETSMQNGAYVAMDEFGKILSEKERIDKIFKELI